VLKKIFLGNYDVVHAFWGRHPSLVNYLICLFSQKQKKLNKPVLSMFVGAYDIVNPGYFVPMGLSVSDVVFTHTAANLPFFAKFRLKAEKVNVVHRGIPIYNFNKDKPRDRARFVTASALVVEKNVSAVILAFSRYNKINNNSSLVVCGDGPQIANLRRLVSEIGIEGSVAFLGHIDRKELFDIMLGAGVFVFLSEKASERLPNVIKEAMLAGCGVVSSKSIGISELIVDENYGFVVDSSNTKEIDLAIRKLVEEDVVDSNNRIELCRRHILSNFSDISSMEIYASEWMRVMERKNNAT
jgi:glycosyltransferase involved in cell wall biosynthesis